MLSRHFMSLPSRGMAAAAASQPARSEGGIGPIKGGTKLGAPMLRKSDSGVAMITQETENPIATLAVLVRCGTRHETYDQLGTCAQLRICAGLASRQFSSFGILRNVQQAGGILQCSLGREHMMYKASMPRDRAEDVLEYLVDAALNPAFKRWEVDDTWPTLELDIMQQGPAQLAIDLVHKAAFRTGLGNPIHAPEYMVGKYRPEGLKAFHQKHFTQQRTAVVGLGVEESVLASAMQNVQLEPGQVSNEKPQFYSDQLRLDKGGSKTWVSLVAPVAGLDNTKEQLAARVIMNVLGHQRVTQWGSWSGKVPKETVLKENIDAKVTGVFFPHSDVSLLGVTIEGPSEDAGKAVSSVAAAMRNLSLSEQDFASARRHLLVELESLYENPIRRAESFGIYSLVVGQPLTKEEALKQAKALTLGDVQAVAKKVSGGKWAMSAVGNLGSIPYLESL